MKLLDEFKKFAIRGNVIDLAVGVIIGGAFGKIVNALVSDIIMPPISVLLGKADFTDLGIVIKKATDTQPAAVLKYGDFLQTILNFLIIAISVFILVKIITKLQNKKEIDEIPEETKVETLLTEIRDYRIDGKK